MQVNWPLDKAYRKITTRYGELLDGKPHNAIDISAPDMTPVYAPHAAYLVQDYTPAGGNTAMLLNGDYMTRLCHLAEPVGITRRVTLGDKVGNIGRTGTAWNGYHLHWEMKINGEPVNPLNYIEEAPMPGNCLLRYQAQIPALPDEEVDYINASGIEDVLIINPDWGINRDKPLKPPAAVRFWFDGEPDKALVYEGAAGADKWLAMIKPRFAQAAALGWRINAVLAPNEVFIDSLERVRQLNAFSLRAKQLVRNELGVTFWAYCYSEGNPPYPELYKYHADSAAYMDVIALHEYRMGWQHTLPAEKDKWHMLRYRKFAEALRELGMAMPETRITEHGIDNPTGWRFYVDASGEMAYVEDYETACSENPYIKAIYPFIWHNYPDQWQNYSNSGGDFNPLYWEHVRRHRGSVEPGLAEIMNIAGTHVIAQVPDFALYKHITGAGLVLASGEFSIGRYVYQWGFDASRKVRILFRTAAPAWAVEEYQVVNN